MNSTYGLPLVTEQKRGLVCHYRPRGRSALQLVGVDLVQPSINRANKGGDAICWTRVETTTLEETAKCLYVQRVGCPVLVSLQQQLIKIIKRKTIIIRWQDKADSDSNIHIFRHIFLPDSREINRNYSVHVESCCSQ